MTRRQSQLYFFIKKFHNENNFSPSFQEMADGIGLKSKSGVHRLIEGLTKQQKLRRVKFTARSVEII
jgi:repressor LexA|tara:strand:+ start:316 stop:516 length:201 start_codon:yes stop_codon:yes gene_type:complete